MKSAFVLQSLAFARSEAQTLLCKKPRKPHLVQAVHRKRTLMVVDEFSSNDELLQGADIAENFQLHNESEYIVEVNGDDLDDEGLSVVDVVDAGEEKRKKIRKNVGRLVDEIDANIDKTYTNDADSMPPIGQDECAEFIRTAAKAADQRKAGDIVALRISKLSYISSFLLVATGKNTPQLRAISNLIEDDLAKKHELHPRRIDGVASSGWILLDYGDFLINIFSPEQRKNYNLEGLWRKAEKMDISDCIADEPDAPQVEETSTSLDDWLGE